MWLLCALLVFNDVATLVKSIDQPARQRELISLARTGNAEAQWAVASLSRQGRLPGVPTKQADTWYRQALNRNHPPACLEHALALIEKNQDPEQWLRCAATANLPEAQYLLGRLILNTIAAEDEPHRFEGLAWVALAARAGYGPAERRWDLLLEGLIAEDLERVEQTAKKLLRTD